MIDTRIRLKSPSQSRLNRPYKLSKWNVKIRSLDVGKNSNNIVRIGII